MPKLLEKRPEPPPLNEILEDLNNSSPDDVVFNFFATNAKSSEIPDFGADQTKGPGVTKNNAELTNDKRKRAGKEMKTGEESTEVEECYKRVKTLIESYNYLKTSQTTLTEKCSELEEMGQKVQQQITELKGHLTQ